MMLIGLDIGTSSAKAVLLSAAGRAIAIGSGAYAPDQPKPGWSEQDPRVWWSGACAAVRACMAGRDAGEVKAIGLSGQMHGSVLLSREAMEHAGIGAPAAVRPAMLWNDQRTSSECAWMEARAGGRMELVRATGNAALAGMTLPKLLWLREHEPRSLDAAALLLLPKDYVRLVMTGEPMTDVGDASGTLLFDVARRRWSERAIAWAEVDPAILPRVVESGTPAGTLTRWAAEQMGLRPGTLVVAGSGDNQCGGAGVGAVAEGTLAAIIGTSGVVYAPSEEPRLDLDLSLPGRLQSNAGPDGSGDRMGGWCVTGCMLSAGGALDWAARTIAPGVTIERLLEEAGAAPPGCAGLIFLPYLTGERCPHADAKARAGWIGLTSRHTRGHMIRAVLEGVAFAMGQMLGLMRGLGTGVREVRITGGGARSTLWRQICADAWGVPVAPVTAQEGSALGAALLAGVGAGVWPDLRSACAAAILVGPVDEPAASEDLSAAAGVYARGYHDLRAANAALHAIDSRE